MQENLPNNNNNNNNNSSVIFMRQLTLNNPLSRGSHRNLPLASSSDVVCQIQRSTQKDFNTVHQFWKQLPAVCCCFD